MTFSDRFSKILPTIEEFSFDLNTEDYLYVGVIGFEDRSLAVLTELIKMNKKFSGVLAIEYLPFDIKNRKDEFDKMAMEVLEDKDKISRFKYNRFYPGQFSSYEEDIVQLANKSKKVVLDISGMSRMLILVLLQSLRKAKIELIIVYTEAKVYHPTQAEFNAKMMQHKPDSLDMPCFLTGSVYNILTTASLSAIAMQGYPALVIGFPTFNYNEITAILNEINLQNLVLIDGKPHKEKDYWRTDAIDQLNMNVMNVFKHETLITSTFNYIETLEKIDNIYINNMFTRKIIVTPTGSKLQTFAVFIFKQMRPDIQILYPVASSFTDEYTEGYDTIWKLTVNNFYNFYKRLDHYRLSQAFELYKKIRKL